MGKIDNALVIYISGDNDASAEGSPNATPSEILRFNGIELPAAAQMRFYDGPDLSALRRRLAAPSRVKTRRSHQKHEKQVPGAKSVQELLGENLPAKYLVDAK
jgi:hypothetical protein